METFLVLVLVAVATGQQFQQTRDFTPAVRLASLGFFPQTGGSSFASSRNDDEFLSNSGQSTSNLQNNQRANFRSGFAGSGISSQSGSFLNNDQFQTTAANRDQFQSNSFQQNQQNALNAFQQSSGSTFQSDAARQVGGNQFQSNNIRGNFGETFQSGTFQQNSGSGFQTATSRQDTGSRIQDDSNQQNAATLFLDTFNQQNDDRRFQANTINRSSQQNQFQDNAFQRSGSSFEASDNTVNGVFEPLNLPSGASLLLGSISTSFSCVDRPYGYYADPDNFCRVFYVCNPALFSDGTIQTYQYSFMCGEGTVFDQKELTCVVESAATPCQEASNYYIRNQEFGRPQDKQF